MASRIFLLIKDRLGNCAFQFALGITDGFYNLLLRLDSEAQPEGLDSFHARQLIQKIERPAVKDGRCTVIMRDYREGSVLISYNLALRPAGSALIHFFHRTVFRKHQRRPSIYDHFQRRQAAVFFLVGIDQIIDLIPVQFM